MKLVIVLTTIVVVLTSAMSAFAAPKPAGYLGVAGNVQNAVGPSTPAEGVVGETAQVGQLPFTGTDLIVFTAAGLLLIGVGFSMRRVSRRRSGPSV